MFSTVKKQFYVDFAPLIKIKCYRTLEAARKAIDKWNEDKPFKLSYPKIFEVSTQIYKREIK